MLCRLWEQGNLIPHLLCRVPGDADWIVGHGLLPYVFLQRLPRQHLTDH